MMKTQLTLSADVVEPVSLAEMKEWLRIDADNTDEDSSIRLLIRAARISAEEKTRRVIAARDFRLDMANFNGGILPISPVISVDSVKYLGADGVLRSLAGCEFFPHPLCPELISTAGWPVIKVGAPNAVQITLKAGMSPVPEDIVSWILMRVSTTYSMRVAVVEGRFFSELPRSFVDGLLDDYVDYSR